MSAVTVRDAEPEDAEAVAAMAARFHAFHGAPGGMTASIISENAFGSQRWFEIVLAEKADRALGYALFHNSFETGHAMRGLYLSDLWVEPDARRMGVGASLLHAVAERGRLRGAGFIWLVVQGWNAEAQAFYAAHHAGGDDVKARALMIEELLRAR